MEDGDKGKEQLISDLAELRQRIVDLEESQAEGQRARDALKESEEMHRTLVHIAPDAVTITDLDGNITYVSPQTLELHGFSNEDELIGRSAFELIAPEDHGRATMELQKTLADGFSGHVEYDLFRKDGSRFAGELSAALIKDAHGHPKSFVAFTRDITERKWAEDELRRINRELEVFATTASHDLKGPISVILSASGTLDDVMRECQDSKVAGQLMEVADIIRRSSENAGELINNLLALAKVGQTPFGVSDVDVREIVEGILREQAVTIEENKIRVVIDDELGCIKADPTQIYQLFSNLITNAIIHNDNAKPEMGITHLEGQGGIHRYQVRDNGSGIPDDDLEKVFMPLYRGKGGGTGIGLAIVKKIVRVYAGDIVARNDGGTCFEFTIKGFRQER